MIFFSNEAGDFNLRSRIKACFMVLRSLLHWTLFFFSSSEVRSLIPCSLHEGLLRLFKHSTVMKKYFFSMVLTENVHHCFIVFSLGVWGEGGKRLLSSPLPIPLCWLYSLLIDLLCRVLIPNCAEYSTNRPPVTLKHACWDAFFFFLKFWVTHSQSTQSFQRNVIQLWALSIWHHSWLVSVLGHYMIAYICSMSTKVQ